MINEARKCLENLDKECAMRKIEELVRNRCHDGRSVSNEIANSVRELFHSLWLISNYAEECELLKLRELGISKTWIANALHKRNRDIDYLLRRYGLG